MTEENKVKEENVQAANLWSKVKAQCLNANPFIGENSENQRIVRCPRCETWTREQDYTILSVMPQVREWAVPVRKCSVCSHLFALCE